MASPSRATVRNRKLAMDAVKAGIRARGDKVQLYTHAWLVTQSNAMIGPWLVAQAKRQIAERYSQVMSKGEKLRSRARNRSCAQNGACEGSGLPGSRVHWGRTSLRSMNCSDRGRTWSIARSNQTSKRIGLR